MVLCAAAVAAAVAASVPIKRCAAAIAIALAAACNSLFAEYNMPKSTANPINPNATGTRMTSIWIAVAPRCPVGRAPPPEADPLVGLLWGRPSVSLSLDPQPGRRPSGRRLIGNLVPTRSRSLLLLRVLLTLAGRSFLLRDGRQICIHSVR